MSSHYHCAPRQNYSGFRWYLLPVLSQRFNMAPDCIAPIFKRFVHAFALGKASRQGRDFQPVTTFLGLV